MWKNKINILKIVTFTPKEQKAIIVLLGSLEGNVKAEMALFELTAADVNTKNGLTILIKT